MQHSTVGAVTEGGPEQVANNERWSEFHEVPSMAMNEPLDSMQGGPKGGEDE